MNNDATLALLREHLQMAVPLFIFEFLDGRRQLSFPRPDLSQTIAQYGDHILYRGEHTAEAVNALCEALATLAFCPGGVSVFGLCFEVPPERQQGLDIDLHQLLSFVRDLSSAQPQVKAVAQLQMPLFGVEELLAASPGVALGGLYRDFISMVNGDESAYPSAERLAQYQRWAEELVTGGAREREGGEFRRFCRVRLEGKTRGLDLHSAGMAFRRGQDFPVPQGWECLAERGER